MSVPIPTVENRLLQVRNALALIVSAMTHEDDTVAIEDKDIRVAVEAMALEAFHVTQALIDAMPGNVQNQPAPEALKGGAR